jgi:release factor glutamine methyltransferase
LAALAQYLSELASRLSGVSETPALDTQVLAADLLGVSRAWILAHPEVELSAEQVQAFMANGCRLEQGEPLPYLLGHWEFFGLDFIVSPAVLIPRPETELLVEQALAWLRERRLQDSVGLALDVGCGSGCIAVALAKNTPRLRVIASDCSSAALGVARENITRYELADRVACVRADLLPALIEPVDLVCANLPYIPSENLSSLRPARWEPALALDGGLDGLEVIRRLLEQLSAFPSPLAADGLALLEIEASQGEQVLELAARALPRAETALLKDLAGRSRCLCIQT